MLSDPSTGRPQYSSRVNLTARAPTASTVEPPIIEPPSLDNRGEVTASYGTVLFHGPSFQVLNSVTGLCADGCAASISGVEAKGWAIEPWVSDPALVDGGLQLALLWHEHMVGRRSLPTSVGSIRVFSKPVAGPLAARLIARESSAARSLCDVVFCDAEGNLVAQLTGVQTHTIGAAND
jgi:hypothetical protein